MYVLRWLGSPTERPLLVVVALAAFWLHGVVVFWGIAMIPHLKLEKSGS